MSKTREKTDCEREREEAEAVAHAKIDACRTGAFTAAILDHPKGDLDMMVALHPDRFSDGCLTFAVPMADDDYRYLLDYTEAKGIDMVETMRRAVRAFRQEEIT